MELTFAREYFVELGQEILRTHFTPVMSRTISPAIISPAVAGTKEMLAGMLRLADSPSGVRGEGRGSSLE